MHETRAYGDFAVGDRAQFAKTITDADITLFAGVSGDHYGVHVDDEVGRASRYGRRIAHGMLTASLLSTVHATLLGGPGGLYVAQTLRFRRPVFIGDTLTASAEVVRLEPERRRIHCATRIVNQLGVIVVDGDSILQKDPR